MKRTILHAMLAACVVVATPARAQDTGNAAVALRRFEEGRLALEEGRYEQALTALSDSYQLQPSPNSRLYIARAYAKLGKVGSAYVNFRFTAREANDRLVVTGEKRYSLTRDAAVAEEGDLEPRVPRLTLAVPGGVPEGFTVTLNGKDVPRAVWGTAVEMDPGHVVVHAEGPRMKPFDEQIDVAEGEQRRVEVSAARVPTAVLAVRFSVWPAGLAVDLDGAPLDPRDLDRPRELDAGPHTLYVRAPQYVAYRWKKVLADGQREEVSVDLAPGAEIARRRGTPPWLFFGAIGASAVTAGVATYFALHAQSLSNAEQKKPELLRDAATKQTISNESTIANVLIGTAAVFVAGTALLGFSTEWRGTPKPQAASLRLLPWIGVAAGGISAEGRF